MSWKYFKYIMAPVILLITVSMAGQQSDSRNAIRKLKVNTADSKVNWIGKKPAAIHSGYVKLSGGELVIEDNEIKGGSFTIDMNTITDLDLRDADENKKLTSQLKSANFLDVAKYPAARFVITRISKTGKVSDSPRKATHTIEGDLTIKGKTNRISFDASINFLNGRFTASTMPFTINRARWGINYQPGTVNTGLKDQIINDNITLSVELVSE